MDVLEEILDALRLSGGVVVDAQARGDWCMISQFTREHCALYFPVPGTLIGYHYIRSGELWAEVEGQPPVQVRAGSVLVFPRNDRHLLYTRAGLPAVDADDLLKPGKDGPATILIEGAGQPVEIYCGFLGLSEYRHPLFDSLPAMLVLEDQEGGSEWVASLMRFLSTDRSPGMVARLAQLFVGHAIRNYVEKRPEELGGWAAGLRDQAVARALHVIHSRYAEELDVETLAREAAVSRTTLCERFAELIGEPPMRYCARWRMRLAANMLRDGKENTANISYSVGFNSEAAFNRAFKREFGDPPATWKRKAEQRTGS
jgi:AraC-like DNA-binding protein